MVFECMSHPLVWGISQDLFLHIHRVEEQGGDLRRHRVGGLGESSPRKFLNVQDRKCYFHHLVCFFFFFYFSLEIGGGGGRGLKSSPAPPFLYEILLACVWTLST